MEKNDSATEKTVSCSDFNQKTTHQIYIWCVVCVYALFVNSWQCVVLNFNYCATEMRKGQTRWAHTENGHAAVPHRTNPEQADKPGKVEWGTAVTWRAMHTTAEKKEASEDGELLAINMYEIMLNELNLFCLLTNKRRCCQLVPVTWPSRSLIWPRHHSIFISHGRFHDDVFITRAIHLSPPERCLSLSPAGNKVAPGTKLHFPPNALNKWDRLHFGRNAASRFFFIAPGIRYHFKLPQYYGFAVLCQCQLCCTAHR